MTFETAMALAQAGGPTVVLMIAGWYFLEYQKSRDAKTDATEAANVERLSAENKEGQTVVLAAIDKQDVRHQQVVLTLFSLTRETVQTCGSLSNAIAELARSVQELRVSMQAIELRQARDAGQVEMQTKKTQIKPKESES